MKHDRLVFFFVFFSDATVFLSVCASPPVTFKIAATALMRYSVSLCRDPDLCGLVLHTQQQRRRRRSLHTRVVTLLQVEEEEKKKERRN